MKIPKLSGRIKENLIFFGPGLLLAITAAGEAGITEALEIGAHFGLMLIWVVAIALIFKYAFTTGIARYTLATGKTIFEGFDELPGPRHWGSAFTVISYIIETMSLGAMILFVATFLNYLIPNSYSIILCSVFILILAMLVLRTHIYHHFEKIMAVLVLLLGIGIVFIIANVTIPIESVLGGLVPSMPPHSEGSVLAIIGVVGSGLNLMLYSVWLEKRTRGENRIREKANFRRYLKSVKLDISIGFVIVAVVTVGFMGIGYIGFRMSGMIEGTPFTVDSLVSIANSLFSRIPYGQYILMAVLSIIFFGAITVGLDARASAITKIFKRTCAAAGKPIRNTSITYNLCLLVFAAILMIAVLINNPLETIRISAIISAILFGIYGFFLIYLNSKLPDYARGNRLWVSFIGVGSILSIGVALLLEGNLLTIGLEILKNLLLCLLAVYILIKSSLFTRCMNGTGRISDRIWILIIFTCISVFGTIGGVPAPISGTVIIGFGIMGCIMAGLVGGPVTGTVCGILGGFFHLSWANGVFVPFGAVFSELAVPCAISMILAGLISGIAVRIWQGRVTITRVVYLSAGLVCLQMLSVYPTFVLATGLDTDGFRILNIIGMCLPSVFIVTSFGLCAFVYFARKTPVFGGGLKPMGIRRIGKELGELIHQEDLI